MRAAREPSARDDQLERYAAIRMLDNGMVKLELVMHPEEAESVWAALNKVAREGLRPRPTPTPAPAPATTSAAAATSPASPASPAHELGDEAE